LLGRALVGYNLPSDWLKSMGQKRHNTLDIRANHHLHYSSTPIPELT